ncbi:MAG TPA: DUF2935 domain-containing protein [Ruminiclostridium sp.]|nr:DUF2935 domain-containing protein [Ruminiclostridium sp.]
MDSAVKISPVQLEYNFWLQILGDHARFIYHSLSADETEHLQKAKLFIHTFDSLLNESKAGLQAADFKQKVVDAVQALREFKLYLLTLTLKSRVKIHMSPTFFNHMLNELDEFVLTLSHMNNDEPPLFYPVHYNLLWLSDGKGHAAAVSANLDEIEKSKIEQSNDYEKTFTDLYLKTIEMSGYTRTKMTDFPSMRMLNRQAFFTMTEFREFLLEIRNARTNATLLGTLMPLMADHMAREECYYLTKLSLSDGDLKNPECDPARPRVDM